MLFNNRRYLRRQSFELQTRSLKIHKKGLFDEIEYEIPLESIHNKKTIQTEINNNLIVTGVFFFAFSFLFLLGTRDELTIIFSAIGLAFMLAAFINRKKTISIPTYTADPIILYFNTYNKLDVVNYSEKIIEASNNYLLNKYSKIDRALPIEPQIDHLKFLLDREIISESDFESLKNQLLGRDEKSFIGFSHQ